MAFPTPAEYLPPPPRAAAPAWAGGRGEVCEGRAATLALTESALRPFHLCEIRRNGVQKGNRKPRILHSEAAAGARGLALLQPFSLSLSFPHARRQRVRLTPEVPVPTFFSFHCRPAVSDYGKFSPPSPASVCPGRAESPPGSGILVSTRVLMRFPDSLFCGIAKGSVEVHTSLRI